MLRPINVQTSFAWTRQQSAVLQIRPQSDTVLVVFLKEHFSDSFKVVFFHHMLGILSQFNTENHTFFLLKYDPLHTVPSLRLALSAVNGCDEINLSWYPVLPKLASCIC